MNITLTGTKVTQDGRILGFEDDCGVNTISVVVDTDATWNYKLDIDYANEQCCCNDEHFNIINLRRDGDICSAVLIRDMLPYSGRYAMQLRGINDDGRVYHSEVFNAWVKHSLIKVCDCQKEVKC